MEVWDSVHTVDQLSGFRLQPNCVYTQWDVQQASYKELQLEFEVSEEIMLEFRRGTMYMPEQQSR